MLSLLLFHSGLALFFWVLHYVLTGKRPLVAVGGAVWATILTMFPGLLVTFVEIGWDPLWVNITAFQLTLSSTYVLASAMEHARGQIYGRNTLTGVGHG